MAIDLINNGQEDWLNVLNGDLSQIGDNVATTVYPVTLTNVQFMENRQSLAVDRVWLAKR